MKNIIKKLFTVLKNSLIFDLEHIKELSAEQLRHSLCQITPGMNSDESRKAFCFLKSVTSLRMFIGGGKGNGNQAFPKQILERLYALGLAKTTPIQLIAACTGQPSNIPSAFEKVKNLFGSYNFNNSSPEAANSIQLSDSVQLIGLEYFSTHKEKFLPSHLSILNPPFSENIFPKIAGKTQENWDFAYLKNITLSEIIVYFSPHLEKQQTNCVRIISQYFNNATLPSKAYTHLPVLPSSTELTNAWNQFEAGSTGHAGLLKTLLNSTHSIWPIYSVTTSAEIDKVDQSNRMLAQTFYAKAQNFKQRLKAGGKLTISEKQWYESNKAFVTYDSVINKILVNLIKIGLATTNFKPATNSRRVIIILHKDIGSINWQELQQRVVSDGLPIECVNVDPTNIKQLTFNPTHNYLVNFNTTIPQTIFMEYLSKVKFPLLNQGLNNGFLAQGLGKNFAPCYLPFMHSHPPFVDYLPPSLANTNFCQAAPMNDTEVNQLASVLIEGSICNNSTPLSQCLVTKTMAELEMHYYPPEGYPLLNLFASSAVNTSFRLTLQRIIFKSLNHFWPSHIKLTQEIAYYFSSLLILISMHGSTDALLYDAYIYHVLIPSISQATDIHAVCAIPLRQLMLMAVTLANMMTLDQTQFALYAIMIFINLITQWGITALLNHRYSPLALPHTPAL